jgi:hypothetical protein
MLNCILTFIFCLENCKAWQEVLRIVTLLWWIETWLSKSLSDVMDAGKVMFQFKGALNDEIVD